MEIRVAITGAVLVSAMFATPASAQVPNPCAPDGSPIPAVVPECDYPVPDEYVIEVLNPVDPDGTPIAGIATDDADRGEALCQLAEQDGNPYTRCTRG